MDWMQVFIIITGLTGQMLVGKRNPNGFLFWIAGNTALIYNFLGTGQVGLAALYVIYSGISLYSIKSWRKASTPALAVEGNQSVEADGRVHSLSA